MSRELFRLEEHRLEGAVFGPLLLFVWSLELKHCYSLELVEMQTLSSDLASWLCPYSSPDD